MQHSAHKEHWLNPLALINNKIFSAELPRCNSSLGWLSNDTVNMLGPYLYNLRSNDVNSSPKEKVGVVAGCSEASGLQKQKPYVLLNFSVSRTTL